MGETRAAHRGGRVGEKGRGGKRPNKCYRRACVTLIVGSLRDRVDARADAWRERDNETPNKADYPRGRTEHTGCHCVLADCPGRVGPRRRRVRPSTGGCGQMHGLR